MQIKQDVDYLVVNLEQAIEHKDLYVPKKDLIKMVEKNYEEISKWTYSNFTLFAYDLANNDGDLKQTKREYDFK